MFDSQRFNQLIADGKPSGEVVSSTSMIIRLRGLEGVSINSLVLFENGDRGLVRSIRGATTEVLALSVGRIRLGMLAVLEQPVYHMAVGEALVGRIINVLGEPLDGKGPITTTDQAEVFALAPGITERAMLSDQLVTGVAIVDSLFPFVLGQRLAILGDSKAGKSTFLRQLTLHQVALGQIVIHVLIAKRQADIDTLVSDLTSSGALEHSIVVVASSFEALSLSYLAPYVGCAIAEHLWRAGRNVIIIYDDLSSHAKIYRELSLLAEVSPGRDSYPGDMFYAHSSLLERAGKLASGPGTLTALPVILTPNDDITAYLPTNVMSITDGQIIFDLQSFRQGVRPAVNVGLSVSRVGGRVQSGAWKHLSGQLFKQLAAYRQAAIFAQFGSELSTEGQADLALGRTIYQIYKQRPGELYGLEAQYLMLATAMMGGGKVSLNVELLKTEVAKRSKALSLDEDPTPIVHQLLEATKIAVAS